MATEIERLELYRDGTLSHGSRVEMAGLRVEMRDLTSQQTRTLMLGLVGSITAFAITQFVVAALG